MNKSKLIIIAAVGAVVLLIGAGIARAVFAPQAEESPEQIGIVEEIQSAEEGGSDQNQVGPAVSWDNELVQDDLISGFINTRWQSDDGASELSILNGAFVEQNADKTQTLYFVIEDVQKQDKDVVAEVWVSSSIGDEGKGTVVTFRPTTYGTVVASDAFSFAEAYTLIPPSDAPVTLLAATDALYEYFGCTEDEVKEAIQGYIQEKRISAENAKWTGEAYTDFTEGTRLSTFILDDPAASVISLTQDADGKFQVL